MGAGTAAANRSIGDYQDQKEKLMAKKLQAIVKLQLPAGKATPAPPVGTALWPSRCKHHGVREGI